MVEHVLAEVRVRDGRHALVRGSREVAVVVAHEDGDATHDGRVDLVGGLAPLLHGVVQEDVLVHVVRDFRELGIVLLPEVHDGDLLVLAEGLHELLVQVLALLVAKRELQGLVVEGHRHQRAVDVGEDLVVVVRPLREAREVLVHALALECGRCADRTYGRYPGVVQAVVGGAGEGVPALDDGNLVAAGLRKARCAYSAGGSRAHDGDVVVLGVEALRKTFGDTHVD